MKFDPTFEQVTAFLILVGTSVSGILVQQWNKRQDRKWRVEDRELHQKEIDRAENARQKAIVAHEAAEAAQRKIELDLKFTRQRTYQIQEDLMATKEIAKATNEKISNVNEHILAQSPNGVVVLRSAVEARAIVEDANAKLQLT